MKTRTKRVVKTNDRSVIRSLILPIYLPMVLMSVGMGMIMLVIPLLSAELAGSYGRASLVFAMVGVGTFAADIPSGLLISRIGVKPAMLLGIFTVSISSMVAAFVSSAFFLGIIGFCLGAGRSTVMLSRMTYIAESTTRETGRAMATAGGMMRIGMLFGPIIGGYSAKLLGFDYTLVIAGLIIGFASVFTVFLNPENGRASAGPNTSHLLIIRNILVDYKAVFLTTGTAATGLQLLRAARVVIVPFWGSSIGLDAAEIGLVTGISMGLELSMFYPVGMIMDRFGRKWTAVPCIAILGSSFALIPLSHDFISFLLVVLVAGVGNGLGSGIFLTLGADFSPAQRRSDFLGVWRLIGDIGHTSGPFLVGLLTSTFSLVAASFVTASIGLCSAAIMFLFVKDSRDVSRGPECSSD